MLFAAYLETHARYESFWRYPVVMEISLKYSGASLSNSSAEVDVTVFILAETKKKFMRPGFEPLTWVLRQR